MIDLRQLAASTLELLQAEPRRYRYFGVYWYLIKTLLKHYYTQDNLYLLGDYRDESVIARMPPGITLEQSLEEAIEQYQLNATYSLDSNVVADPDGEEFILFDADAGL